MIERPPWNQRCFHGNATEPPSSQPCNFIWVSWGRKKKKTQNFENCQFLLKHKLRSCQRKVSRKPHGTCLIFPPSPFSPSLLSSLSSFFPTLWALPSLISVSPLTRNPQHIIETAALRGHFQMAGGAVGSRVFMGIFTCSLVIDLKFFGFVCLFVYLKL